MTQTEAFLEFKKNPNLKMGQRSFEKCRPFFVIPPRAQDRNSCCCKLHVEIRMIFKACVDCRRKLVSKKDVNSGVCNVHEHLSDMLEETLCPKGNSKYNAKACLSRCCESCEVDKFGLLPDELDITPNAPKVRWQRFEYVNMKLADGQEKRKLQLVTKETAPGELFQFLKSLLKDFPSHQFRASWQHEQLGRLLDNLPQGHVCCIHDYSENYMCSYQNQVQSMYFGQNQASIHVTVLHRHALTNIDGVQSSINDPVLITEHIFVISPEGTHR